MPDKASKSNRPRILIADDHSVLAQGLRALLCDHYDIVGMVADGRALVEEAKKLQPNVIIADIGMPLLNGLDAADEIRQFMPKVRFVFLTMMDEPNLASAVLRLSPVGYVLKHSVVSELLTAIDEVLKGKSFLTRRVKPENWTVQKERSRLAEKELTARQRNVLQLLAEGHSMKEVADILQVSQKTVEFHKYYIMKSRSLRNNAEIVRFGLKNGLIPP